MKKSSRRILTQAALTLGILLAAAPATFGDDDQSLVVDDDNLDCPNADFTSIQAAVNFAAPGATIVVCDGIYHERVTITTDGLRLRTKERRGGAVVDGDLMGHCSSIADPCAVFWVLNASGVRIEGFILREGHEAGILLDGASNTRVRDNLTTGAGHDGIQLFNSRDNLIEDNVTVNNPAANACGINVAGPQSTGNVVRNNLSVNNEFGIQLAGSTDNLVSRNRAIGNRGNGIRNVANASGNRIERNHVLSNGFAPGAAGANNAGIFIGSGNGIVVARNQAFDNAAFDLRSLVTTAAFRDNRCNTSSPPGLCERNSDVEANDDDDDDD